MAIPEACGLWIEQRVQEELDNKKDTGASLREIGRMIAAEVEKHFETKVKPDAITKKASRINRSVTNVTEKSKPTEIKEHSTPEIIENRKPQGGGAREGSGRKPKEVKEHIPGSGSEATEALQFSCIAISQLERIRSDDPKRSEALGEVALWIKTNN